MNSDYEKLAGPTIFVILYLEGFPYSLRTPKTEFGRRSYGHPKLEANNKKNDNCVPPRLLHTTIACCSTLDEFMSLKGSEFGYTYFKKICSPISLVYLKI